MIQSEDFAKAIAFGWWPFLAILKMLSFFEYSLFFRAVFCIEQLQSVVETFLACYFAFLIFDPKWRFCKGYSVWLVAIFCYFQISLIFRIVGFFWSRFSHRTTAMCCRTFLACYFAFLIFDPKWRFCKGYSVWLVAIFGHFENALIFRIFAFFSSRFLHRTTAMCCRNVFSMFFCIFNFWPKVTILQRL